MGLKNNSKELNNYANISPLSSEYDVPFYTNTPVSYNKKYPYSSQSSTTSSSQTSILKKYTPIQNPNGLTYHRQNNVYANLSKLSTDNTIDMGMKTLSLDENNNNNKEIYENMNLTRTSSPIYINLKQDEDISRSLSSTNFIDIETKTKQTIEKSEVNITPNCNDKRDLYRTKISTTITKILPIIRQRRVLHRSRRYNRRNSTSFRTTMNSNAMRRQQQQQQHQQHSNHRSIIKNNQREHSPDKSVSNQLYNEIQQAIPLDNQSINSYYTEEIFESPTGLDEENLCWYPAPDALIPQVFSISENGGTIEQGELTNEEEEEEEEELHPHNTFEDFLLRRPSKSSCSSLASVTNTLISEKMSPEIPSPINRRSSGVTLSLDKKDVDFIHNIIQRTHGNERVSNRITALREAYIRAENKKNDLLKIKKVTQINTNKNKPKTPTKHSMITSKIRQELERYDELPIHKKAHFIDDDDDDDSIYSTNDNHRYHHRKLPPVPSKTNRIINFVTTLKRQLQKNFQEIRSKILIETMSNPSQRRPTLHNTSGLSHRYRSRPKTSYNMIRRANSHQLVEHSYPFDRHQFSRSHSDASQIHSYHPLSFDRHSSHRPRTFRITPHSPRR